MARASDDRGRRPWSAAALLAGAGVAALLALWRLDVPLWGSEGRWAVIARSMLRSGDWFSLTLGAESYPDKPFGSYWLIALAALARGRMDEVAARLPSALCWLSTALATFELGRRTRGARVGALAAMLVATGLRLAYWGRAASADPQNLLGITVALLLVLEASERRRWWQLPALAAVVAVTCLMKGLSGLAVPAFVALAWSLAVRGFGWLRTWGVPLSALLFGALLLAPFVVARFVTGSWSPLELLWRESVVRAVDPFDHEQPWYFYFWNQFELLAPWSLLLPAALWHAVRDARAVTGPSWWRPRDEAARRRLFPLFAYAAILLLFTLSRSRRSYYLLPIAPFAALLVAGLLEDGAERARDRLGSLARAGLGTAAGLGLLAGLGLAAIGFLRWRSDLPPDWLAARADLPPGVWPATPAWIGPLGLAIALAAAACLRQALRRARAGGMAGPTADGRRGAALPLVALCALLTCADVGVVEPLRTHDDPTATFGARARELLPPDATVEFVGFTSARLVWSLDRRVVPEGQGAAFRIVESEDSERLARRDPGWIPADPLAPAPGAGEAGPGWILLQRRDAGPAPEAVPR